MRAPARERERFSTRIYSEISNLYNYKPIQLYIYVIHVHKIRCVHINKWWYCLLDDKRQPNTSCHSDVAKVRILSYKPPRQGSNPTNVCVCGAICSGCVSGRRLNKRPTHLLTHLSTRNLHVPIHGHSLSLMEKSTHTTTTIKLEITDCYPQLYHVLYSRSMIHVQSNRKYGL